MLPVPRLFDTGAMGTVRLTRLEDLTRWQADLRLSCPNCNHTGLYCAADVVKWFRAQGWNTSLDIAPYRFRCSMCGHKPVKLSAASPDMKLPPERPMPKTAAPCPAGVDPKEWSNADARQQKRLVDRLRG